jgi:TonB-linked outer membrane protein, SusC/RagA family/TonB-dependent outer membrane receptor, SusC/RagA subfamily, signature region
MINKNIITVAALLLAGSSFQMFAQTDITVSGTVKDIYGNPLPGVIVSANNADLYITDKDGKYTAVADRSDDLTFSLLGYKQAVAKAGAKMDVVLENDAHSLAQSVNLGYSHQYREVLSDAVSTVSGDDLSKSLMSRLQGTFSGMFSGLTTIETSFEPAYESLDMYIRGLSTIHGGTAGVVIDGILYDSYAHDILYRISPEEVESVSVLKDGASQAIYGVKGANGLIVINTKRGTPGKLKIGVNISETVQQPTFKAQCFDSYTYASLRNQAGVSDGLGEYAFYPEDAIEGFRVGGDDLYPNTDWYDMLVRKMFNQQRVALDATGGNDNVKFYSNFNVARQGSFFKTDPDQTKFNSNPEKYRINFRSNIDIKVNSWISLWMNLAGSVVRAHTPSGSVAFNSSIYNMITYMPSTLYGPVTPTVTDDEGNVIEEGGHVTTTTNIGGSPYGELNRVGYTNCTNTNIYGQAGMKFDLSFVTPGLWAGGSVGYLSYITASQTTTQSYSRYTRDADWSTLSFTQHGTTIDGTLGYGKSTALYGYLSYKAELGWARNFGKHHIATDAYATYQEFDDITGNISATYDFRRVYSGAELMYDFDKRYAVKLSTGYSASDAFPRATRWIWTPGVSAAWIASNESFIKDVVPAISLLKLRASYAVTGNDTTGYNRYDYKDQVTSTADGNIPYLGYYTNESVYGNPNLSPEKIKKVNLGVDFGLFNQFQVSFDAFKERMDNGVTRSTALVPSYQGISLESYPITNLSKYENKGWELAVSYNKRFNSDFGVNFTGHVDYNKNKVIYVGESGYDDTYAYPIRTEGFPYGQSFGYLVDWSNGNGLFNFQDEIDGSAKYSFGTPRVGDIKYQDLNNDGVIDEKDKAPIGNGSLPRYSFAFNAGFTYRNFEVNLLFQDLGDYKRNYLGLISGMAGADGIYSESHLGAWTEEKWLNDEEITFPALSTKATTNNQNNDFLLRDASFLRLKNAEIAYKMPRKVCDFLNASSFKVYLSGQNLFTIDDLGIDMPVEGGYNSFPICRMYRLGINLTF